MNTMRDVHVERGRTARLGRVWMVNDLCSFGLARRIANDEGTSYGITPRGSEFLDTRTGR